MMTTEEINTLQQVRDGVCVTILMPLYTSSPEDQQQTPIRLKNLLNQAQEQLKSADETKRKNVLSHLNAAISEVDDAQHANGLAIFANEAMHRVGYLPYQVQERIYIEPTFVTRELVLAAKRSPRYRVLSVTEKSVHLYEGTRDQLHEIHDENFPKGSTQEGVQTELTGNFGVELSTLHDTQAREFFHRVDAALGTIQDSEPLPLALAGVERTLAYFDKVTKHGDAVVARLHGNFEKVPQRDLETKIWPLVDAAMTQSRDRVLQRVEDAVGANRAAFGVDEVWAAAQTGRVDLLLAEDNFHCLAHKTSAGDDGLSHLQLTENAGDGAIEVADEIIETVLQHSGDVTFFEAGRLSNNNRLPKQEAIAAILRY